ncbi:hypothetical protein [Cytobacillus firmus]|uniref:hypothetical protein n=1 Tax=Cytobacillus firmus TaxID=1399 RepID=UPI001CFEB2F5|nr:hypothetical protein [Cytobacillus firmus]
MNSYINKLYPRGFLLTDIESPVFNNQLTEHVFKKWGKLKLGEYTLFFDASTTNTYLQNGSYKIFIQGLVLNPFDNLASINEIANKLLFKKMDSEVTFLDYLDQLSGRFVIITQNKDLTEVYNDACGTRTVFYNDSPQTAAIASHSELIADLLGYKHSKKSTALRKHPLFKKIRYLPGLYTPFDEVKPLTPNTKLLVEKRKVERIFPRSPIVETTSVDNLVDELVSLLKNQVHLLAEHNKVSVSLTAGIDSRLTYAMFSDVRGDIDYFTHINTDSTQSYIEDVRVAKELARMGNSPYRLIEYKLDKEQEGLKDFTEIWLKNLGMNRGSLYLFKAYTDLFPEGRVHVRSNLAEIARTYYRKTSDNVNAKVLSRLYTKSELKNDPEIIKSFQEFIKVTGFKQENLFNFDYADLFYWEHRMSLWHSYIVLESDMAYETYILYNNRALLTKMLSAPIEIRESNELFIRMIQKAWPEVLDLPVNGEMLNTKV